MNKSGAIGTRTAETVVRYLKVNGFPYAERRPLHGAVDLGDITGTIGLCWQVKGGAAAETASDQKIAEWLDKTDEQRRNASAAYGVLVTKRKGVGPKNCGAWWAIVRGAEWADLLNAALHINAVDHHYPVRVHLRSMVTLLRTAGYGDPHPRADAA